MQQPTALNDGEAKSIETVPTDYLDEPIDPCTHYERYESMCLVLMHMKY